MNLLHLSASNIWAGRKTLVHHLAGKHPPFFIGELMKELSVFIDESGDWGEYESHSPYYIMTMVLHDQSKDISEAITLLDENLRYIDCERQCIHAGPIIRGEAQFRDYDPEIRRKLLKHMMYFIRRMDINIDSVYINKKETTDNVDAAGKLAKKLAAYIRERYSFFNSFECVKIYYDNGQIELNKILATVFNTLLDNVEFKRVQPADYRLFQVADVACTLKLAELKMGKNMLSKSEITYFENERTLKKNYLKPLEKKRL